jgi:hypothetical protein
MTTKHAEPDDLVLPDLKDEVPEVQRLVRYCALKASMIRSPKSALTN